MAPPGRHRRLWGAPHTVAAAVLCYNKEAVMKGLLRRSLCRAVGLAALALMVAPASSWAAFDGSTPMLCALSTIMECDASGECERHNLAEHPDVLFLRVNVKERKITAGASRQTEIKTTSRMDGKLILQGGENGRGWTATITEATGRLSAGIAADDFTFSLFGACTNP